MKINRRVVVAILVAGVLFLAGILLRDFLLESFVKPMALLLWIGNRLIASIDQIVYWAGLILALTLFSLQRLLRQLSIDEVEHTENGNATLNSIGRWRTLILLSSDETDRLNFLKQSMQKLLKDIYASRNPSQVPWKVYQDVEQGEIALPDSVRKFLMINRPPEAPPTLLQRLRHIGEAPAQWKRHWTKQDLADYYRSIDEAISFMEKELENEDE